MQQPQSPTLKRLHRRYVCGNAEMEQALAEARLEAQQEREAALEELAADAREQYNCGQATSLQDFARAHGVDLEGLG